MKTYEDEAFDELEKKLQKQVAHGVTDGSLWRKRQEPEQPTPKWQGARFDSALHDQPPQRTWVGLTNAEVNNFAAGCHLGKSVQGAIYEAEAKLKQKNAY